MGAMKTKAKSKPTYTATRNDGKVIYANQPHGNLFGQLPLGVYMDKDDLGAMSRTDGGDPWDGAKFHLEGERTITVRRDS